jgi:hypothetical protein
MWKVLLTALFFISVALVVTNLHLVTASAQATKEQPPQPPNVDLVTASAHATKEATKEQPPPPPPQPEWIDADGKVKLDKAPREVLAIGVDSGGKAYEKKTVPGLMDAVPPAPLR